MSHLQGIEGNDLVELDMMGREALPAVASDFKQAESLIHPWATERFARTGAVGNYPNGPSAEWSELATLLEQSLNESITHLDDTSAAIRSFLEDILRVDSEAKARMDKSRAEAEGVPG